MVIFMLACNKSVKERSAKRPEMFVELSEDAISSSCFVMLGALDNSSDVIGKFRADQHFKKGADYVLIWFMFS